MKCRLMRQFIKVYTVCLDNINLQRKKYNIDLGIIPLICDPLIYTMYHSEFNVCIALWKTPLVLKGLNDPGTQKSIS